jgi:hypothetical protein
MCITARNTAVACSHIVPTIIIGSLADTRVVNTPADTENTLFYSCLFVP